MGLKEFLIKLRLLPDDTWLPLDDYRGEFRRGNETDAEFRVRIKRGMTK